MYSALNFVIMKRNRLHAPFTNIFVIKLFPKRPTLIIKKMRHFDQYCVSGMNFSGSGYNPRSGSDPSYFKHVEKKKYLISNKKKQLNFLRNNPSKKFLYSRSQKKKLLLTCFLFLPIRMRNKKFQIRKQENDPDPTESKFTTLIST